MHMRERTKKTRLQKMHRPFARARIRTDINAHLTPSIDPTLARGWSAVESHPNLNSDFISDVAWTFAMYLESAALIPQLYMFQKQKTGVVELLTAHFVAALGFGRILEFAFWIYSYHELASASGSKLPGYLAIFSQFMQLILMLDFFWYYYVAVKNATPLVLPTTGGGMGIV